jgi:hypothetical protein
MQSYSETRKNPMKWCCAITSLILLLTGVILIGVGFGTCTGEYSDSPICPSGYCVRGDDIFTCYRGSVEIWISGIVIVVIACICSCVTCCLMCGSSTTIIRENTNSVSPVNSFSTNSQMINLNGENYIIKDGVAHKIIT